MPTAQIENRVRDLNARLQTLKAERGQTLLKVHTRQQAVNRGDLAELRDVDRLQATLGTLDTAMSSTQAELARETVEMEKAQAEHASQWQRVQELARQHQEARAECEAAYERAAIEVATAIAGTQDSAARLQAVCDELRTAFSAIDRKAFHLISPPRGSGELSFYDSLEEVMGACADALYSDATVPTNAATRVLQGMAAGEKHSPAVRDALRLLAAHK